MFTRRFRLRSALQKRASDTGGSVERPPRKKKRRARSSIMLPYTLGAAGLGLGGYLAYRANKANTAAQIDAEEARELAQRTLEGYKPVEGRLGDLGVTALGLAWPTWPIINTGIKLSSGKLAPAYLGLLAPFIGKALAIGGTAAGSFTAGRAIKRNLPYDNPLYDPSASALDDFRQATDKGFYKDVWKGWRSRRRLPAQQAELADLVRRTREKGEWMRSQGFNPATGERFKQ